MEPEARAATLGEPRAAARAVRTDLLNPEPAMSRICQVTGKKPQFGKQLSHSHRRSSRRWDPNIQIKRYYLPSEKRWIRLRLSTKAIKTIDRRGIESVVAEMRRNGRKV